uniref:Uncharacterized protein n=1 Tax=Anguilla anguilla TaxID=7936 RepID=A0A0E9S4D0_ANGAN
MFPEHSQVPPAKEFLSSSKILTFSFKLIVSCRFLLTTASSSVTTLSFSFNSTSWSF